MYNHYITKVHYTNLESWRRKSVVNFKVFQGFTHLTAFNQLGVQKQKSHQMNKYLPRN